MKIKGIIASLIVGGAIWVSVPQPVYSQSQIEATNGVCRCHSTTADCFPGSTISFSRRCNCGSGC